MSGEVKMAVGVEMLPVPLSTAEAVRIWLALNQKEAAALYERRDLARFSRDLHGQLTEDERALYDALTKRLRYDATVVAIQSQSAPRPAPAASRPVPLPNPV